MNHFKELPSAGLYVIIVIGVLFAASLLMLGFVCLGYKRLSTLLRDGTTDENAFLSDLKAEFTAAYKTCGDETNTPVIIQSVMGTRLSGLIFCERFLNNAVSVFVTLGLFGTFLGLSMSVSSLTQLISYSNTSEWLSVLDSVGEGLMSALSGMGVAFYTSLVGAGCSIILTILRTVFSPQSQREKLSTQLELWLDNSLAPTLPSDAARDEIALINKMIRTMEQTAGAMEKTLYDAGTNLRQTIEGSRPYLAAFHQTVDKFNTGVRDYSEVDYNLRGSVERLDLAIRDFTAALRQVTGGAGKGDGK